MNATRFLAPLALALALPAMAELSEAEVKAGFVYNFAKLTEWPAEVRAKTATVRLCVNGPANEFSAALAQLRHRPALDGHPIEVLRVVRPGMVRDCHLLVFTSPDRVPNDMIAAAASLPVLTVGDVSGFAAAGGMIGLYPDGDKLRFEVNTAAAQAANLKLSSHLLRLGRPARTEDR